ncbi:MAG TPA: hypothetical protein VGX50_04730, partial [Longimicrobium sp.]|nr:hypothetical protein [Longimicrobium sp.]
MADAERRRALEQRRRELQERSRLQPEVRGIKRTLDYFVAHGIPYTLERDPAEGPANWVIQHFPYVGYTWVRLDWERVSGAVRGPDMAAPEPEVIAWFDALEAAGRIGDCEVVLITDNGGDPMIHVRFADIRAHPGICQQDGRIWWIVCLSGRWVIQQGDGEPWWWG